jgi:hypothetical protein
VVGVTAFFALANLLHWAPPGDGKDKLNKAD